MNYENYVSAVNNQILFHENEQYAAAGISLPNYLKLIRENNPALKVPLQNGETINILPSNKLVLPIDKEAVLKKGFIDPQLQPLLDDRMTIELPKKSLLKDDLIFLDLLTHNNWERPIYFTSLFTAAQYNLAEYTQVEGMVYRLMPVRVPGAKQGLRQRRPVVREHDAPHHPARGERPGRVPRRNRPQLAPEQPGGLPANGRTTDCPKPARKGPPGAAQEPGHHSRPGHSLRPHLFAVRGAAAASG
jgi:hypothetical protein